MENTTTSVNVYELGKLFTTIYNSINKKQLAKAYPELRKLVPSETSEVFMSGGCCVDDNIMTFTVYVSNPKKEEEVGEIQFDKLVLDWLMRNDTIKVKHVDNAVRAIVLNEQIAEKYNIEFMPVFYHEQLGDYVFHFVIYKTFAHEKRA